MRDETYDHWLLEDQFVEFVQFVAKHSFALFAVSIFVVFVDQAAQPNNFGANNMQQTKPDLEHIMVTIEHPFGTIEAPLTEWIAIGPGPRPLLAPSAAYDAETGTALPLSVIPFRYRNTFLSRLLIRLRLLPRPWPNNED